MKRGIDLLAEIFHDAKEIKEESAMFGKFPRNGLSVFSIHFSDSTDKKIIIKSYEDPETASNEQKFYGFFRENRWVKIPEVYYKGECCLITEFIESEKPDIFKAAIDWARVHSYTKQTGNLGHHIFKKMAADVLENKKNAGNLSIPLEKRLMNGINSGITSTIHNDLHPKNILSKENENYYIDFEFSSKNGSPARDLSLLLFNRYKYRKEITDLYLKNIDFTYDGIKEDISTHLILKSAQLLLNLNQKSSYLNENLKNWVIRNSHMIMENELANKP